MSDSRWSTVLFCLFASICAVMGEHEKDSPIMAMVHKTLVVTAHSCMDQINATETDLEYLRHDPPYPEKASCIIKCLLEKVGIVKNNKYSKAGFTTAVTPLVFRNKKKLEHMKTVSDNCDKEIRQSLKTQKRTNIANAHINHHVVAPCELGNEIVTCIFKYAPELHFKG